MYQSSEYVSECELQSFSMAPLKGAGKKPSSYKRSKNTTTRPIPPGAKNKVSKGPKASKPVQQKTKSKSSLLNKKRKVYTDKELGLPKLNMITPVGVDLPKGKKKGKVFVDDQVGRIPRPGIT